jgi:SPP1 gp7 family putative phage head morphogenesis protein
MQVFCAYNLIILGETMKNPIIPRSKTDPVGANRILTKALKEIDARFKGAQSDLLAAFNAIPVYALNELSEVAYGLSNADRLALAETTQRILDKWLVDGKSPDDFFYATFSEQAVSTATAIAYTNIATVSATYAAAESLSGIVNSQPYQNAIATAQFKSYSHWTGLAAQTKADLMQIITQSVADGKNPKSVVTEISDRLGVSRSKARQYSQTDITDTLRQTTINEDARVEKEYGIKTALLWTSAFLATTRQWHASRSGRVYSAEEVKAFYASGKEKFNCHCSVTTVLLDENNKPMLTKNLTDRMAEERKKWEDAHGE